MAFAGAAQADCGGVKSAYPAHWHHRYRPALVVGDSTMLFAVPVLARLGMEANAHGCRMWSEGMALLRRRKSSHTLPHLVVMGLGANWTITRSDIEAAVALLGPKRVLGLIVPLEERGGTSSDAHNVRRAGRRHPNRIKVLDWPHRSVRHAGWFSGDGLHLSYAGAAAYARFIATLKPYWAWPRARRQPSPGAVLPER